MQTNKNSRSVQPMVPGPRTKNPETQNQRKHPAIMSNLLIEITINDDIKEITVEMTRDSLGYIHIEPADIMLTEDQYNSLLEALEEDEADDWDEQGWQAEREMRQ